MRGESSHLTSVMVGDDGSAGASAAVRWARHLGTAAGAELTVVHAGGGESLAGPAPPRPGGGRHVNVPGHPVAALLDACRDLRADIAVVGRRGAGGFTDLRLGGTAHQLTEHSLVPVAVIPEITTPVDWPWPFRDIVVGVDGSASARAALDWTVTMAVAAGGEVTVVHAVDFAPFAAESGIDEDLYRSSVRRREVEVGRWCRPVREAGVAHGMVVSEGGAAGVILEAVKQVGSQLVVVGRRSEPGYPGLPMGSVAHRVVAFAPCPVIVVPQPSP